jgi:hypothetical protein
MKTRRRALSFGLNRHHFFAEQTGCIFDGTVYAGFGRDKMHYEEGSAFVFKNVRPTCSFGLRVCNVWEFRFCDIVHLA